MSQWLKIESFMNTMRKSNLHGSFHVDKCDCHSGFFFVHSLGCHCRSPFSLCLYRQKTVYQTRRGRPRPLLGSWWVVMSMSLYPMGCRRLLDLQPRGQVTLWGHCMESKCRRNGLKRLSSGGDMSGHASFKGEGEKWGEVRVIDVNSSTWKYAAYLVSSFVHFCYVIY